MPNTAVPVVSTDGYQPSAQQVQRLQNFLQMSGAPKQPSAIVLIPENKFGAVAHEFGGDTRWAFSVGDRVYMSTAVFDPQHMNTHYSGAAFPEFVLGHELGHLNDSDPRAEQEAEENAANQQGSANPFDLKGQAYLKQADANEKTYAQIQRAKQPAAPASTPQPINPHVPVNVTPPRPVARVWGAPPTSH